jgi:D-lactate dehydrogenase
MLMLITLKQLPQTLRQQQTFGGALGRELQGKTIGIMGTGRIGKRLIELLASWDVEIIAWDAYPDKTFAAEHGITYVSKTKLLATSDIISLHLPLFSNTRHIINRAAIKRMKKGAILINTARGELVDSVALLDAIKTEHLAGAGLDVLDQEDFSPHSPLISTYKKLDQAKTAIANARLKQHEHVIVTPHCAFHTEEAIARIISQTVATITALCQGESIPSLTDSI